MDLSELGLMLAQGLTIILLIILPHLILFTAIIVGIQDTLWKIIKFFLLIILPWIVIGIGVIIGVENFNVNILDIAAAWYYLIPITWFGSGIIIYSALEEK